ncbi:MAG: hypothetical protein AAGH40_02425 [Verrucomicrobiota bacterium]
MKRNRPTKYLIIALGIILIFVVASLEKTEIYESDAVVTVIGDGELNIEIHHPDPAIEQQLKDLFDQTRNENKTMESIEIIKGIEASLAGRKNYLRPKEVEPGTVVNASSPAGHSEKQLND